MVEFSEDIYAVSDCLGICRFVCHGWNSPKLLGYGEFAEMLVLGLGLQVTPEALRQAGRRVVDVERLLTTRCGLGREDDTLPRRYFEEPFLGGSTKGHRIDRDLFAQLLSRYYQRRGWDQQGRVLAGRRQELGALTRWARPCAVHPS